MNLIKKLNTRPMVSEEAAMGAVSGGSIASAGTPLFAQMVRRAKPKVAEPIVEPSTKPKAKKITKTTKLREAFNIVSEDLANPDEDEGNTNNFDRDSLIGKLKGLEKRETTDNRNTVTFGLQDDNGGLIRVVVQSEEADDFERALESFLMDREGTDEDVPEIAEILFQLKDQFNIVDVQWPEIAEDEEQEAQLAGGEGQEPDPEGGDLDLDPSADMDMGMDTGGAGDGQVQDLLTQVIDMMKADAEARKAEARAKEAEAKAKEADAIVAQAMSRVKQEEQYLDMETYNKARKDEDREAKRLAQLAKFKHEMGQRDGGGDQDDDSLEPISMSSHEEEETHRAPGVSKLRPTKKLNVPKGRLRPHDIAQYIIGRVK
jgi:hypothetical protein